LRRSNDRGKPAAGQPIHDPSRASARQVLRWLASFSGEGRTMRLMQRAGLSVVVLAGGLVLWALALEASAQEVTVLCNYEVDWCEAMKAAYEKTTGSKAVFIRRTDGESLAQIRAEKGNPRA